MWSDAIRVAVVFAGLWILAISVRVMSFFCKRVGKKENPQIKAEVKQA
jgi:Na+-transporting methylmalonyl-CoA/oxaloacetate decarboxylase gamma subunit